MLECRADHFNLTGWTSFDKAKTPRGNHSCEPCGIAIKSTRLHGQAVGCGGFDQRQYGRGEWRIAVNSADWTQTLPLRRLAD
jgi:hypothetical protein